MIKTRIPEIDVLRGIACMMVVFNHFGLHPQLNNLGLNLGCVGVDLFFIISGFVISLTIHSNKNSKNFIINRFSRLFPTYWVCVSLSALCIVLSYKYINEPAPSDDFFNNYLINLSMFQFYLNTPNIDGSYWTLIIELLFYGFILVFLLLKKTHLIELIGAACLIIPLLMWLFSEHVIANKNILEIINDFPLFCYFPLFFSGILFYNLFINEKTIYRWLLLILCFIIQLGLFDKFYSNKPELTFLQYAVILTIFYSLFILLIYNKLKVIISKFTVWLGNISFSLYLIHQSIGVCILTPLLHNYFGLNFTLSVLITLAAILVLSHLIHNYIEKPSMHFIRIKTQTTKR